MSASTLSLLRSLAYTSGPACRTLPADAREIASRRGVDGAAAERFAVLTAKLDATERLPTAEELAELGALARQIDTRTVGGKTYRRTDVPAGWIERLEDDGWTTVPPGSLTLPKSIRKWA